MSTSKRIISLLLALVMVLGMLPWDALGVEAAGTGEIIHVVEEPVKLIQTEEPAVNGDGIAVTRAQWLQMLVEVFDYHIEDGIVPDNYFTDLHEEAEYYEDILVAVYYGLVDVLPNSPMEPEAAATREFAVSTLNSCMGYLPESEPTFAEAAEVTYPNDIQVALEQGWFALTNGAFLPEQPITTEEFALLQAAAESYVEDFTIVPTESQYVFKDGIIEITDKAAISTVDDVTTVTIENLSRELSVGDRFVVYSDGLALPYVAQIIVRNGTDTVITTSRLAFEDAIETMLVQQVNDANPANFYAAEGAELIFIEEESGEEYTQQAVMEQMAYGSKSVYIPKFSKKISVSEAAELSLTAELKNSKICYNVDIGVTTGEASVWLDTDVELSGTLSCDLDKVTGGDIEIFIGGYEVPGVGGLSVYFKIDVTGSISVVKKYHMEAGVKIKCNYLKRKVTKNAIFELVDKGSRINAEISAKVCLEAKFGLYGDALPLRGYIYAEGGFKATVRYTTYMEIGGNCTHFAAYLYSEFGAKLEWGMFGETDEIDWNYEIIDEAHSPVKVGAHYEDGRQVHHCTRGDLTGTTTGDPSKIADSGYSTGYQSSYWGSGLSSGGSSQGYGSDGEPVIIYTYSLDDKNNATITSYKGNATSLTIPLMLDGYNVTAIGSNAFKNKTSLRTVIVQDNILTIGDSAFYGCSNLRNLTLSESLTEIGNYAFERCVGLTMLDMPDSVTNVGEYAFCGCENLSYIKLSQNLSVLGNSAFRNCSRIREVHIPKSLTKAGNENWGYDKSGAFHGCSGLKTVTFEAGITEIPQYLFTHCTGIEHITIPNTVTVIEERAFSYAVNLKEIHLGDSVVEIGDGAFAECRSLEAVIMPDSVTTVGNYAFANCIQMDTLVLSKNLVTLNNRSFYNCSAIKQVLIPKSLTTAGNEDWGYDKSGAFHSCSALKTVTFEDGVTEIPQFLFTNCTGLERITIPDTVTVIEERAFSYATNLHEVKLGCSVVDIKDGAFAECTNLESMTLPDTVTTVGEYAFANCILMNTLILSKNLVTLNNRAFYNCSSVTEIHIPKSLTKAGNENWGYDKSGAFHSCSGLKSVTFDEGVTEIPQYLFTNCTGIETISIPDTVKTIEECAFYLATNLKELDLGSVTSIGFRAFSNTALEEATVPETVSGMGKQVFDNCTTLTAVTWSSNLTYIPENTFNNCTALTTLNLPDTLTAIYNQAFSNCDSLVTFAMPDSVTTMSEKAFYDCDALQEIHLSEKLQKINSSTFYNCDTLTSIVIPYGVTSIGSSAFYDCDALKTVQMANSVTSLGSSAFKHCDVLKNVKLSRNLTSIPSEAFRECAELEEIVIPYFTTKIEANAFNSSPKLTKVVVHEKLASINTSAFSYADRTVFYGPTGSYTNTWCTDNGYFFIENTAVTTKVTAAESSVTIPKGKTYMLDFDIDPIDFHEVITTKSSNTAVATVDESGKITAVAPGTATIKIIVGGASASCKVTVTQAVTKITLNKTKLSLDVPQTYQLTATITPSDASNKTLNWTSSNPAAATVDANGLVTAVGNGTAVIKAESTDGTGISASCTVTVVDPSKIPVSGIALDKNTLSLEAMEDYQLTATVSPANAANKGLIWSSSNEAVATVDSNGKVTAVAKGTATITATAADGYGASASCTVTVTNNGYLVTDLTQFQSSHPYADRCTDFWIYRQSGAGSLSITFAAETEIEDGFDYLYIYDGEGNLIGKYTGTELANQTITIPGDTVKVQIESDDSGNAWGFQVVDVEYTDHNHSFTNYVSDGNATCTEDGTKTAKCDHCDLTDTIADVGSALGHNMGAWNTVRSATCTENGEEQRNCTRCNHSESRTIEAVGHRWDNGVVTREPTEGTEGERLYTCTACGATRTESIPVIGHEHSYETIVTAPTCTEQGYTTYTCRCGESYTADYVDALGHVWGDWIVLQEPTTTENGVEEHTCTRCGHAEQRSIAKLENPFNDVAPGSFFYEPVMWAIENGITNGTSATTFGPNDQCMRAHVVTFLWRAVGSPEPTKTDNPFVDVKPTDFYYKPVLWAVENGITSGMDATHFGPTAYCNRAQVVTFLYRTMGSPDVGAATNPFTDVAAGSFYEKPVLWAVENGVTAGLSATSFGPNSICNRAQIVTFLYRAFVD